MTGCSADAYWDDPFRWGLEAERVLGSNSVIDIFQPVSRGGFRCVDGQVLEERSRHALETMLADIAALPDRAEVEAAFDEDAAGYNKDSGRIHRHAWV